MTFLDPISGLAAAAIGVPVLLSIYFLKLRRRELRVTSTLLWEQAVKDLQVNVPLRWLRVSTVLILQLLALLALAAALGRPAIPSDAPAADRTVIIIDHSASMSARDGMADEPGAGASVTRLEEAKRRAIEMVRELSRGTTSRGERPAVTIVESAAAAGVVLASGTVTADIEDAIRQLTPTDHPGGIGAAVELLDAARAAAAAAESGEGVGSEEVVAFTDSAWAAGEAVGTRVRVLRVGAANPALTADGRINIGIVALSVRRDPERPETIRVFARVASMSSGVGPVTARVMFDGAVVGVRTVDMPAGGGDGTLTLEFDRRDGGVVLAAIDPPEGDLLESDNAAGAVIGPVTTPAVLIVAPDEEPLKVDPFLLGFFESLHPRLLRAVSASAYAAEADSAAAENRRSFPGFSLVVFDRTAPPPGRVPGQPSISFGSGLPLAGLDLRPAPSSSDMPGRGRTVRFDSWRRGHPLMRYVALEPIVVSPAPATIAVPEATESGGGTGDGSGAGISVLASGPDGPLIACSSEGGVVRRVVVSFPLLRSNWGPDTSFAVFMSNAVDALTGRGDAAAGGWVAAGRPVIARPSSAGVATGRMLLRNAAGTVAEVAVASSASEIRAAAIGIPPRVGVYELDGAESAAVCVNLLSEAETRLGRDLGDGRGGVSSLPRADSVNGSARLRGDALERTGRREVWHWFVLAAMGLAAVEWVIFALRVRP